MEKQIFNPPIPYIGPIYRRNFSPGKIIRIQGFPPGYAYRFDINLQCGYETAPPSDVALQISVRLLDDYISLNSLQNGIWDEEQCGLLVIKRREKFEITLICDFNQYKVAINDQHYCEFPQRIHYDHITHLTIDGDVSIIEIYYDSASTVGSGAVSASALNASALVAVPLLENGGDGFQIINTATRARNVEIQHPSPSSEFSELPSYEAALAASNRPPYPTSNPIGMPNPTCVSEIMGISYPPNHAAPIFPQLYSAPSIPPPPPAVSNVRPVRRFSEKKLCLIG